MIVVVYVSLILFCLPLHCVAMGENFKAKAWESVCSRQLLLDKLCTRIYKLFVSIP